jgi:UDP-N-acetylmuramoyl-L-alanine---L-glutamate ligase
MEKLISEYISSTGNGKRIAILGLGREGRSTFQLLTKYLNDGCLIIADKNPDISNSISKPGNSGVKLEFFTGENYLEGLKTCDLIIKSPGISLKVLEQAEIRVPIVSQTGIFLHLFRRQVIGVTGTKGKSTTVSLIYEILKRSGKKVLLGGNIGVPPFDLIPDLEQDTTVVYEMSSHQLEGIKVSPHIAVLLNIFQEHLDHYNSYLDYQLAKFNIACWQQQGDFFIYNPENPAVNQLVTNFSLSSLQLALDQKTIDLSGVYYEGDDLVIIHNGNKTILENIAHHTSLSGAHNLNNIAAAAVAAHLSGAGKEFILEGVKQFKGLPHRLEKIGIVNGITFINDSISTIPEATIEALKTFPQTQTLLLGGYDRGVEYTGLCRYLKENPVKNIVFIGRAGERIKKEFSGISTTKDQTNFWFNEFDEAVKKAIEVTLPGQVCLLSPAASSYDMFRNFEERGKKFRQLIQSCEGFNSGYLD